MSDRKLWDTAVPETMVLLARVQVDEQMAGYMALPGLWLELQEALEVFGGNVLNFPKEEVYFDTIAQKFHFDVFIMIETKGGWHD